MKTIHPSTRFPRSHQTRSATSARPSRLVAALTLAALAALPLGLSAQNKRVNTTGTTFDSNNTYTSITNEAALYVSTSSAVYSGTAITLIDTTNSGFAIYTGAAHLFSSTILNPSDTAGSIGSVSQGTLYVYDSIAQGNHGGINVIGEESKLIADNFAVTTATTLAINIYYAGTVELRNSCVTVTTDGGDGVVIGMWTNATLKGDNLQIIHAGADGAGIINGGGGPIMLTDSEITAGTGIVSLFSTISINLENTRINAGTGLDLRDTGDVTIIGGAINSAGGNALLASSAARYDIAISDHAAINGGITNTASGTLNVNVNASTLTSDIANTGAGSTAINLNADSHGRGGFNGGSLSLLDTLSTWNFTAPSTLDHVSNAGTLDLGDHETRFGALHHTGALNLTVDTDTGAGGKILVTGAASGDGTIHIDTTGHGSKNPAEVLPGLVTIIGQDDQHWKWDYIDWGLETLLHDTDGTFHTQGASPAGAVLNSAVVLQQAMWFAQNDSLAKRLGDLRLSHPSDQPAPSDQPGQPDQPRNTAALWTRAYAQRLNLDAEVAGRSFTQQLYGIDLGADRAWPLAADSATLHAGLYLGYARADADYNADRAEAELTSTHGGLYATYRRKSGLYIDAILKIAAIENTLRAPAAAATTLEAGYDNLNLGLTLELGQRFTLRNDWFMEPQLQLAALRIRAKDYTAATPDAATTLRIAATDIDALQARLAYTVGKRIRLANGALLHPYAHIGGAALTSSGGEIRNAYQRLRPNIDGLRAEFGAGVVWQLSAAHQLYFDYEASYAEDYSKPWGLTAGYRWQF